MARKKGTTKVKPPSKRVSTPRSQIIVETPPFHITFPITLIDKREKKICYFQCEPHMRAYIDRYKLKKTEIIIQETTPKEPE